MKDNGIMEQLKIIELASIEALRDESLKKCKYKCYTKTWTNHSMTMYTKRSDACVLTVKSAHLYSHQMDNTLFIWKKKEANTN